MHYKQYAYGCERKPMSLDDAPVELLYNFLENLDNLSLKSCSLVCKRWRSIALRLLLRTPCLSGPTLLNSFHKFVIGHTNLARTVRHLHICGAKNYSDGKPTQWIREVPRKLAGLLPNVRSITFSRLERPEISEEFQKVFTNVTSLTVTDSRFKYDIDVRSLIFYFPKLTSLTISHVRWYALCTGYTLPIWSRALPLQTVRLNDLFGRYEYTALFHWLSKLNTVQELEVVNIPPQDVDLLENYLHHLANQSCSLRSFSFSPSGVLCAQNITFPSMGAALQEHAHLRDLRLAIPNMAGGQMAWVPQLLKDLRSIPLTHIEFRLSLDVQTAEQESCQWSLTNYWLQCQWRSTLQKVTFIHYPVGAFVSDSLALNTIRSRLRMLNDVGLLDVWIGERYEDN